MTYWVCKPDGSIQCEDVAGISLDDMRKTLEALVGADNVLDQKQFSVPVIQLCGMPTGVTNAYELTELGHHILHQGFVGPMGFSDCDPAARTRDVQAVGDSNLADVVNQSGITRARANPVLVRELVGHPVRIYELGSPVTEDYRPNRVNIVTLTGRISDIWFG